MLLGKAISLRSRSVGLLFLSKGMSHNAGFQERTYEDSLRALDSLQSNAVTLQKWNSTRMNDKSANISDTMLDYFSILNVDPSSLSIVHVAGTKGKGSVSAMVESIVRSAGCKTGLFTSPHLVSPRERIKLNGAPISEDKFAHYFWVCWDRLHAATSGAPPAPSHAPKEAKVVLDGASSEPAQKRRCTLPMPPYFRFMTLLAVVVFKQENVDVAVLEVGVGGRTDATNFAAAPTVTAVTALGMDHMSVLGNTLSEIAFEKAGIFKHRRPALALVQSSTETERVLKDRAGVLEAPFSLVDVASGPECESGDVVRLALQGRHQETNAALASSLAAVWLLSEWFDGSSSVAAGNSSSSSSSSNSSTSPGSVSRALSEDDRDRWISLVPPVVRQLDRKLRGSHAAAPAHQATVAAADPPVHVVSLRRSVLPTVVCQGLEQCHWPGRSHIVQGGSDEAPSLPDNLILYFDVAHTTESIRACTEWFWSSLVSRERRFENGTMVFAASDSDGVEDKFGLLFNCATSRDPAPMIQALAAPPASAGKSQEPQSARRTATDSHNPSNSDKRDLVNGCARRSPVQQFDCAVFSTYRVEPNDRHNKERGELSPEANQTINLTWQHRQAALWNDAVGQLNKSAGHPGVPPAEVLPTVADALEHMKAQAVQSPSIRWHYLITGSVYLVGGCFEILKMKI